MRINTVILAALWLLPLAGWAQDKTDTLVHPVNTDTTFIRSNRTVVPIESYAKKFDPRKALLYSAILPGSGQVYNRKYWKVPIVYGGFAALLYMTNFYQTNHNKFRQEFFIMINDPSITLSPSKFTKDQLRRLIDRFRRDRDFMLIMNGFWYILQLVDAHVDAHLKEFDLNPQMQVRIEPVLDNSYWTGTMAGVSLKIRF
jgi:hypothetical protein